MCQVRSVYLNQNKKVMAISVGLVDDHVLFLKSLASLLNSMENIQVVLDASNGEELQQRITTLSSLPDILLVDVDMPVMGGVQTVRWAKSNFPSLKIVALSLKDDDHTIIQMIQAGCCAYLVKDIHPVELEKALNEIMETGFYNSDFRHRNYVRLLTEATRETVKFTEMELQFLRLACSELTYKQIADKMNKAERTVDGYRETLFDKLNVQSRVGLALEAVRLKLVTL